MTSGNDNSFQDDDEELKNKLIEVINSNEEKLLVCIPSAIRFKSRNSLKRTPRNYWTRFFSYNYDKVSKIIPFNKVYGDSLITRFYIDYKDKGIAKINNKVCLLKRLWDKRNVLIIEGENTKVGVGNDLLNNTANIKRILCPNKNAFLYYEIIIEKAIKYCSYSKNILCIIALGPTATVLAYDLQVNHGIQAMDLGHVDIEYMWFLNKADEKIPIVGKNSAEANLVNNRSFADELDQDYLSQIIDRIGC